jgi:hypothetical protein
LIITDKFFSIIEIEEGDVKYLLNKVLKVWMKWVRNLMQKWIFF